MLVIHHIEKLFTSTPRSFQLHEVIFQFSSFGLQSYDDTIKMLHIMLGRILFILTFLYAPLVGCIKFLAHCAFGTVFDIHCHIFLSITINIRNLM
jgi:hypothetical protein